MSEVIIQNGRVTIDGVEHPELAPRLAPVTPGLGASIADWLRKGGWTTVAGFIHSAGNILMAMIVYDPKLLAGNELVAKWISVFMMVGGPALLGLKAAVTQKPQPDAIKPNPTPANQPIPTQGGFITPKETPNL